MLRRPGGRNTRNLYINLLGIHPKSWLLPTGLTNSFIEAMADETAPPYLAALIPPDYTHNQSPRVPAQLRTPLCSQPRMGPTDWLGSSLVQYYTVQVSNIADPHRAITRARLPDILTGTAGYPGMTPGMCPNGQANSIQTLGGGTKSGNPHSAHRVRKLITCET